MQTSIKTCFKCGIEKPLGEFYRHSEMADGHLNKCKPCACTDTKRNRQARLDYYTNYDKHRNMQPHRVAARHQYQQTDEGKITIIRAKKKWASNNPLKRSAQVIVGSAVRGGKLEKQKSCEECGVSNVRIHGHHDDYAKPLDVRWLCSKCHTNWHRKNGEGKNTNINERTKQCS